ncbi:hypothetical protein NDU88_005975 [Pleurodeles waltl]|uniref:Uncharacterized protein n=1 Tax=Pleurodeles waltl TaxID=8319 RepID=A0AAV7ULN7_PLEWA|nr:hypothetical protein NDU88_005975 [Pleurodeles waltl]
MLPLGADAREEQLLCQSESPFCSSLVCERSDRTAHCWLSSSSPVHPGVQALGPWTATNNGAFKFASQHQGHPK